MYRVIFYLETNWETIKNTSQRFSSDESADEYLDFIMTLTGYTGGHIEQYVLGIGWVVFEG